MLCQWRVLRANRWDVLAVPAAAGKCTELTAFAAFSVLSEAASFASTVRGK